MLREVICQAFGSSRDKIPVTRFAESNGANKRSEGKSMTLKWKGSFASKQGHLQFVEDWQEMGTFTNVLEKVESWIFSRIVESVWWQVKIFADTDVIGNTIAIDLFNKVFFWNTEPC